MKQFIKTVAIILIAHQTQAQESIPTIEKKWEISNLNNPESVVSNQKGDVLYVSNVNGNPTDKDENGYISKLDATGKIIEQKWVTGLNAPKGLAIYKGKLFVSDIDEIIEIDIKTASIIKKYKAEGATFLNDTTIDSKGIVYVSNTFGFSGIYKLENGKVELWFKSEDLNMPNGLLATPNGKLLVAAWGEKFNPSTYATEIPGKIITINTTTKNIESKSKPIGNLDGLEKTIHGYLVTDWYAGKLFYYKNNNATKLLDLPQGSADLNFNKNTKMIFIPLMNDNKIEAYQLK